MQKFLNTKRLLITNFIQLMQQKYPDGPLPRKLKFNAPRADEPRSGIMWFKHGMEAGEALMYYNNIRIPGTSYSIKMHSTRRTD